MKSVSPVFTLEEVQFEREIAKDQNQYVSVIGLPVTLQILDRDNPEIKKEVPNWAIAVRMRLSDEERAAVAAGLDLVITQLTFGKQLAPMNFQFCHSATKPIFELTVEPPALASSDPEGHQQAITDARAESNLVEMPGAPSAADLDAVAAEQEAANQTGQPAPAGDQPQ